MRLRTAVVWAAGWFAAHTYAYAGESWLAAIRYNQGDNVVYLDTTGSVSPAVEVGPGPGISIVLLGVRVRPSPYSLGPDDGVVDEIAAVETKKARTWRVSVKISTARDFPYEVETKTLGEDASQVIVRLKEVNVQRKKPDTKGRVAVLTRPALDAPPAAYVNYYTRVRVLYREQGYYLIQLDETRTGWVPGKNLRLEGEEPPGPTGPDKAGTLRARVIASGEKYLGRPYVWGGTGPDGFDCSGLMQTIFSENGITIPRGAREQYEKGRKVDRKNLRPGDLVFFETYRKGISHVGIWLGDGKFLHAESSDAGVTITPVTIPYWSEHYRGAATYFSD